jgi:hypothetical protein
MDIWIKITIISCILSIIVVVLAYYGIFRYMNLRNKECEHYASSYLSLPRVTSNGKVVVSMYAKKENLSKNITLKSILDQTVHPDQIIIITPNDNLVIPEFLKKDSIIAKQLAGDMKSEAAFVVPLSTQKDADTKIIIVTDGIVYGPDFIESIVAESEKFPENVIFVEGYDAVKYVSGLIQKSDNPTFINTEYGVLIKSKMFNKIVDTKSQIDAPSALLSTNIIVNNVAKTKIKYSDILNATKGVNESEKKMIQVHAQHFSL